MRGDKLRIASRRTVHEGAYGWKKPRGSAALQAESEESEEAAGKRGAPGGGQDPNGSAFLRPGGFEAVADAADGEEVARAVGVGLELGAQAADEVVDCALAQVGDRGT